MRRQTWRTGLAVSLGLTLASSACGDGGSAAGQTGAEAGKASAPEVAEAGKASAPEVAEAGRRSPVAASPIRFEPPNRGAPKTRLGGATRSTGAGSLPRIEALVPEEPGWTLRAQPVLYWYLAETTDTQLDFVLLRLDPMETLAQVTLERPVRDGVQRLDLAEHGPKLEPGVAYQWLLKLVPNPEDHSYDQVVGGGIERVTASPELEGKLATPGASLPHVLAEAGIWYDAIDALSRGIDAEPGNRSLWNQRAALFRQVSLPALPLDSDAAPGLSPR
ncbi:MAG: DUF928 domain-containing protein [bacterium]|nr:DUF928 domain-containing protein [bacterium]MDP6242987.1 DUF928 domain-containing protein [Myxococcota bacterium]